MHQINLEKMSPVVHLNDGIASPDTLVGTDSPLLHVDALGVIAVGVGGLEAENVMLGILLIWVPTNYWCWNIGTRAPGMLQLILHYL